MIEMLTYGSEEDQYECVRPERKLYLAVLALVVRDILTGSADELSSAITWLTSEDSPEKRDVCITYKQVIEVLNLGEYEISQLDELIPLARSRHDLLLESKIAKNMKNEFIIDHRFNNNHSRPRV